MNDPLLTIGLISCNRLHYLRSVLESARRCIHYPRIEWIVVDNASTETGLRDYLKSLDWIDTLILKEKRSPLTEHVSAMNEIVERARGDYLMIWPEDVQFIVEGDWMRDCLEILDNYPSIGSIHLGPVRRRTVRDHFSWRRWFRWKQMGEEWARYGTEFRRQRRIESSRGFACQTYGWTMEGITGAGIVSLTRKSLWKRLGPWRARAEALVLGDSSGGGETEMLDRYWKSGLILNKAQCVLPVAADLFPDPAGCKAKVRGFKRYGHYAPPVEGTFYYSIYPQEKVWPMRKKRMPVAYEDFVKPRGFHLSLDSNGNMIKIPINETIVEEIR